MAETCLLAMRCPVFRGRDSSLGSHTELENLTGDAKGKGTSGDPVRLKVLMRRAGADCFVVATKWGNARGAKGAGHPRRWDDGNVGIIRSPVRAIVLPDPIRLGDSC